MPKSHRNRYAERVVVADAWFCKPPAIASTKGARGVRRAGITFETKVGKEIASLFKGKVLSDSWFEYANSEGVHMCSPDHLIIDVFEGVVTIVECKLSHVGTAYYQMVNLYKPVVEKAFPGFKVRGVEICKNFDRSTPYPVPISLVRDLRSTWSGFNNVNMRR